jgi:xanthosine utilization system XapX-like protein
VVVLVGLFGILLGEQVVPIAKRLSASEPVHLAWIRSPCVPHIFGELPTKASAVKTQNELRT